MNKDTPLILVFYLDREMMSNKDIIVPFSESVDRLLVERKVNAIAFFLPAGEGESERIDCINPVYIQDDQKAKVDKNKCIGCSTCSALAPKSFKIRQDGKAMVLDPAGDDEETVQNAIDSCPVEAISWE